MLDTIQKLLRTIPGYTGYEAREKRRDEDYALCIELAQFYRTEQQSLVRLAQDVTDRHKFEYMERMERINQTLGQFIARLENSLRGYSPWFLNEQINESKLDRLYEFDAHLADSIPLLREQLDNAQTQLYQEGDFDGALRELQRLVDGLHIQYNARQAFLAMGRLPEDL
jgi:hypothetical protein